MAKSDLQHSKAQPGGSYLYDEDDFLAFLRDPPSNGLHGVSDSFEFGQFAHPAEPSGKGASGWEHSFVFNDELLGPMATTPAGAENLGRQDLIFIEPEDASLGLARGGSGGGGGGSTTGGFTAAPYTAGDAGAYNITIQFKGTWTAGLYNEFTTAAETLCNYIIGDLPDVFYKGKLIDDIVITAELKPIDGVNGILGQAGPTALRTGTYLPALASMQFDSADAAAYLADGLWDDIVVHEMLHSIGFGTIWSYLGLSNGGSFTGSHAMAAYGVMQKYNSDSDPEYDPLAVPVETDYGPGTAGSHWDEATLEDELMTGFINDSNHIRAVTWASLEDLGYKVAAYTDYLLT
jgi:Leishmanolysin